MRELSTLILIAFFFFSGISGTGAQNLILNPGCEDTLVNGEIPYWTEVTGTNWTQRVNGNPPSYEGNYMFFAGVASVAELQQDVDVSPMAASIDGGNQHFYFQGYVRSYSQNPPDHSRIILEYLDTLKTTKLDSVDLGEHSNTDAWLQVADTTLAPVGTRFIRVRLISTRYNGSNNDGYYDGLSLIAAVAVGISKEPETLPDNFMLYQNYPNPFNPSTVISYRLKVGGHVTLKVYDAQGREVATLVNEVKPAGEYNVRFNADRLSSGVYFYRLQANGYTDTKKLILLK